jgi:hypothetical protein
MAGRCCTTLTLRSFLLCAALLATPLSTRAITPAVTEVTARQLLLGCRYEISSIGAIVLSAPCHSRVDHPVTLPDGILIVTNGDQLELYVGVGASLQIDGKAILRSFFAQSTRDNANGHDGRDAGFVKIEIIGDARGTLEFDNHGENGNVGVRGAPGVAGTPGLRGENAADHLFDCAHGGGDGEPGGPGGKGLPGGKGGKGGNGGDIDIQVGGHRADFRLLVNTNPGTGGRGGDGGPGGLGGPGGEWGMAQPTA